MKEQLRKFGTLILILALCLTSIGTTKVQAASKTIQTECVFGETVQDTGKD